MVGEVYNPFFVSEHQNGDRATWLSINGQSGLLTYFDIVAINYCMFLVVKAHTFDSGAGQNSPPSPPGQNSPDI